jgi:hypothetical protein
MKQLRLSLSKDATTPTIHKRQRLAPPPPPPPQNHISYQNGPVAILPYLYIGNETNAHCFDQLDNIDCLLNVAAEVTRPSYTTYPWSKTNTAAAKGYYKLATLQHGETLQLADAMQLLDEAKKRKKVVLVHCQCGVARSATVVIAYIMHSLHLSLHDAYAFVQRRAPAIGPNLALLYQLQSLDQNKKNKDASSSHRWNSTLESQTRKRKLQC